MRRIAFGASLFLLFSLMSFAQTASQAASSNNPGQDIKDARRDMRESQDEQKAAREEQHDISQDTELHRDVKNGDKAAAEQEKQDIRRADKQTKQDVDRARLDRRDALRDMRKAHAGMAAHGGRR